MAKESRGAKGGRDKQSQNDGSYGPEPPVVNTRTRRGKNVAETLPPRLAGRGKRQLGWSDAGQLLRTAVVPSR